MALRTLAALTLLSFYQIYTSVLAAAEPLPEAKAVVEQFMKGDAVFIENQGQWDDEEIHFALSSMGVNVGLTETGPRFQIFRQEKEESTSEKPSASVPSRTEEKSQHSKAGLPGANSTPQKMEMQEFRAVFENANRVPPTGSERSEQTFNYLIGPVAAQRQDVPSFATVWYEDLYEGISLELKGRRSGLKYNFHVSAGADPEAIRIRYEGVENLSLRQDGALQINLENDWPALTDGAPYLYQEINGKKMQVQGRYRLIDDHTYGFEITEDYDKAHMLIIDPQVVWGSYLGGSYDDFAYGVAVDYSGDVVVCGSTRSSGWLSGGWDVTHGGTVYSDGFVVKLNANGSHEWSTFLGGSMDDTATGVVVSPSGTVYVTGSTASSGWISGGFDTTHGANSSNDAFIVNLTSTGTHAWSSYLGDSGNDEGAGIAIDDGENLYVTGTTASPGWTGGGWRTTYGGNYDAYLAKVSPQGDLMWSTYLGGANVEEGFSVAVDASNNVLAAGCTDSSGWVSGGSDTGFSGYSDGYLVKLSSSGAHQWSRYVGGTAGDDAYCVATDSMGNAYVTGYTNSTSWITSGWDTVSRGGSTSTEGYIVKIDPTSTTLWSSYLGGTFYDFGRAVVVNDSDDVYVTGSTQSLGWITGGWDVTYNGAGGVSSSLEYGDPILIKFDSAGNHQWSTYMGGTGIDYGWAMAVDSDHNIYTVGTTTSSGWISGAWDTVVASKDGYVLKINDAGRGNLRVNLAPTTAVTSGAQWRRKGTANWHANGESEASLPAGQWPIEFKDLAGMSEPVFTASVTNEGILDVLMEYQPIEEDLYWGTYLGGTGEEDARSVATDAVGNIYIAGQTYSSGWVSGGWNTYHNGGNWGSDGFLVKLDSEGRHVWSTYIGGTSSDGCYGVAIDNNGFVFAAGYTYSAGWISGGWDTSYGSGSCDGFVVKLDSAGLHLWSSYLGGTISEYGYDVDTDGSGNVYVGGVSASSGWVSGGWRTAHGGGNDGFVVKLSSNGSHLWSTFLGASGAEDCRGIAVDLNGNLYATGSTSGTTTWVSGGWDAYKSDQNYAAYLVKLNSSGQHTWSTYLEGGSVDYGYDVAVDGTASVYAAGITVPFSSGPDWVSGGWDTTRNGGYEGYIVKFGANGAHNWSSYVGGTSDEYLNGITVGPDGNIYATGTTKSADWVYGGFRTIFSGGDEAYILKASPNGTHLWSAYFGESGEDAAYAITTHDSGTVYVVGKTYSPNLVSGGWDATLSGENDGYLIKIGTPGKLRINLSPAAAVAKGAMWRRAGTSRWYGHAETELGVPPGAYNIEFKDTPGWVSPQLIVSVSPGETTEGSATYTSLDPGLVWGTYVGGTSADRVYGIAVDANGNVCATGSTSSSGWVSGGWDQMQKSGGDGFVLKLNAKGEHLWSSYFGGASSDYGYGVAFDQAGNAIVTGVTNSAWASGGWDVSYNGNNDAFLLKVSPSGNHIWSTYLGATATDYGRKVTTDASGNIYATGYTLSNYWISGGWDTTLNGVYDGYIVKMSPAGEHLWSSFIGGSADDLGEDVVVASSGSIYVAGYTKSGGWVSGGWDTTHGGTANSDGFIIKFSAAGAHVWSSYLGGANTDWGLGVAVDTTGSVYTTGYTYSPNWTNGGWDNTLSGARDGFLVKMSSQGTHLWSTYLGGDLDDYGQGLALDTSGNVYAVGVTVSPSWVNGGRDAIHNGGLDGYLVKLTSMGQHSWSSYIGGTSDDLAQSVALDKNANVHVGGYTSSPNWLYGGWDESFNGSNDGFVAKISSVMPGSIRVSLSPSVVIPAGGQWRRKGTDYWNNSGDLEENVPPGEWVIECRSIPSWTGRESTVTVASGQITEATVTYMPDNSDLSWGTYLGAAGIDYAQGLAVDGEGNVYVTGNTSSTGWVSGGFDSTFGGEIDAYIVKLSPTLGHIWSTFLGGSAADYGEAIIADSYGNVYATGRTTSTGWISSGWDTSQNGAEDAYIVKLNSAGLHLWSTYLGGISNDSGNGIALDQTMNIYITGSTSSSGWANSGFDVSFNGVEDGYIAKFSPQGAHLWSTYFGGVSNDNGQRICAGPGGNIHVTGSTKSPEWVTGGWDTLHGGNADGYILTLNSSGAYQWSSYLGGASDDNGWDITTDDSGNIFCVGGTYSSGWTSNGCDISKNGSQDGYIVKFGSTGNHVWSTYVGGSQADSLYGIVADSWGSIYATGNTFSSGWAEGGWDVTHNGGKDAFVTRFSASGKHMWSTYLGAAGDDSANCVKLGGNRCVYVAGSSTSSGWLRGGWDVIYGGKRDGFISYLDPVAKTSVSSWRSYR